MHLKYLLLFIVNIVKSNNYTLDIINLNQQNQTNSNISYELVDDITEICVLSNRPITFYINNEQIGNSFYNFQELCTINTKKNNLKNIIIDTLKQLNTQITLFIYKAIQNNG